MFAKRSISTILPRGSTQYTSTIPDFLLFYSLNEVSPRVRTFILKENFYHPFSSYVFADGFINGRLLKRDLILQKLNHEDMWIFNCYSKRTSSMFITKKERKGETFIFRKKLRNQKLVD